MRRGFVDVTRTPRLRVGVVIIKDDQILLVRHRKADRSYWLLPGGGLDWGETLVACGAREVREETGYQVAVDRPLFLSEAIDPRGDRHVVNIVMLGQLVGGRCDARPRN